VSWATTTGGTITIPFAQIWWTAFAQEWADIGELIRRRDGREHIGYHRPFLESGQDCCTCFECRVERAWKRAHHYPPPPERQTRQARKRRRGWA
jgi:hypothetical protein